MTSPISFLEPEPLDARLVTKTSLSEPKKAIALLILLWFANEKPDSIEYGAASADKEDGGILDDSTIDLLVRFSKLQGEGVISLSVSEALEGNPLFVSQMESLNSAFELVWHLASFSFVDPLLNRGAERTGGIRYRKRIKFSTNLDLIDIINCSSQNTLVLVLFSWLFDGLVACDKDTEISLSRALAVFAEPSLFKTSKGVDGKVFTTSGIYDSLLNNNDSVDIVDPGEEIQGTTRILRPAIKLGLNPMLKSDGNKITYADGVDSNTLRSYSNRAKTGISLSNVKTYITSQSHDTCQNNTVDKPHNWIYFGAPGTGKSYELQRTAEKLFSEDHIRRVTFYPDYTYSQFVGCFKPCMRRSTPRDGEESPSEKPFVSYEFIPGPFLDTYVEAIKHPEQNYLLIIEELNRANPASVFGDVFQLLDRNESDRSEYEVAVPREVKSFLETSFLERPDSDYASEPRDLLSEQTRLAAEINRLSLPSNMYIWATMNSADQGVFTMDTAFKRRWDFRYVGINEGEKIIENAMVEIATEDATAIVSWNSLRHSINKLLLNCAGVNEDKLLGPFFIPPQSLKDKERFNKTFKDKVLLYLFEDAGRMKRKRIFSRENTTYSQLCFDFDNCGTSIFADDFEDVVSPNSRMTKKQEYEFVDLGED